MHANARHLASMSRDTPIRIESAQHFEHITRPRQHCRRWRIEPPQTVRIACPPAGELEGKRNEVRFDDFRGREGRKAPVCSFAPGTIANTRLSATRAPLPLV